jgi:hypothetical protein
MSEAALALALSTAWSVYRIKNTGVHADDARRCNLERYLALRLKAGETDMEDLAVEGLAYLRKLDFLQDQEFGWPMPR